MPDFREEILAEIRRVLSVDLEVTEPVELDHGLARDLRVDSMGAIVLTVALEDRFHVKLSDEDAAVAITVKDLVDLVERRSGEALTGGDAEQGETEGAR